MQKSLDKHFIFSWLWFLLQLLHVFQQHCEILSCKTFSTNQNACYNGSLFPPIRMLVTIFPCWSLISRPPACSSLSGQMSVTQRSRSVDHLNPSLDGNFPLLALSLITVWMFKPWSYLFSQERSSLRTFRSQNEQQNTNQMDYSFVL